MTALPNASPPSNVSTATVGKLSEAGPKGSAVTPPQTVSEPCRSRQKRPAHTRGERSWSCQVTAPKLPAYTLWIRVSDLIASGGRHETVRLGGPKCPACTPYLTVSSYSHFCNIYCGLQISTCSCPKSRLLDRETQLMWALEADRPRQHLGMQQKVQSICILAS